MTEKSFEILRDFFQDLWQYFRDFFFFSILSILYQRFFKDPKGFIRDTRQILRDIFRGVRDVLECYSPTDAMRKCYEKTDITKAM
jgi:hypothetical protein